MREVIIVTAIYCALFIVLTSPAGDSAFTLTGNSSSNLHHLLADLIFWAGAIYICVSSTFGAFARQDRFALSHNHPILNKFLSFYMMASPFLAILIDVRFTYVLLGLLLFSHSRSRTKDEKEIDLIQSRAFSNMILIVLFTLAMGFMMFHGYQVKSIFDWGSIAPVEPTEITQTE